MKQFKCGDVVPGCQWVTRSEDEQELFEEINDACRNPPSRKATAAPSGDAKDEAREVIA